MSRVDIPADIDLLLTENPALAHDWRMRVREALLAAFADGFAITGFQPAPSSGHPALILERLPAPEP